MSFVTCSDMTGYKKNSSHTIAGYPDSYPILGGIWCTAPWLPLIGRPLQDLRGGRLKQLHDFFDKKQDGFKLVL